MNVNKLVGERGFEPPTPWSRTMKPQTPSALSGVAWEQRTSFSLAQLYRSCTERRESAIVGQHFGGCSSDSVPRVSTFGLFFLNLDKHFMEPFQAVFVS